MSLFDATLIAMDDTYRLYIQPFNSYYHAMMLRNGKLIAWVDCNNEEDAIQLVASWTITLTGNLTCLRKWN